MKSSYVAATAQLSLSRLTVKSACPPLALPFPPSLFTLSGSRQYYPMQHHPTSTRDRFTGPRRWCYFQALTLYIYVLRILYEAWSPVRQRVAVANAFNRQRYNNTISIVIFHFLPVMCARVRIYFIFIRVTLAETIRYKIRFTSDASTLRYLPLPMLRKVLFKKYLKVITHLLAINEPFEFRGRMGLAAGTIQREHVAIRVRLFLPRYRWAFLRYRCNNLRKLLDLYTINYSRNIINYTLFILNKMAFYF